MFTLRTIGNIVATSPLDAYRGSGRHRHLKPDLKDEIRIPGLSVRPDLEFLNLVPKKRKTRKCRPEKPTTNALTVAINAV